MADDAQQPVDHSDLELIPIDDPPNSDPIFKGCWVKRRGYDNPFVPSAVQSMILARNHSR